MEIAKAIAAALFPAMALDAYKKYISGGPKHRYINALPQGEAFTLQIGNWKQEIKQFYDSTHNGELVRVTYKGKSVEFVPTTEEYTVTEQCVKVHGGGALMFK